MDKSREAIDYLIEYDGKFQFLLDVKAYILAGNLPTNKQVDAVLRCKARDIKRKGRMDNPPVEEGMYRVPRGTNDADIFKVQRAIHGSGNLYAKRLVPPGEFGGPARFEYVAGAIRNLLPEHKMTLEEAKRFGALYGTCCVCGRTLTDEVSIANGIGPICEGKGRWA